MNEPETLTDWLAGYRRRRRPEYDTDAEFEFHMRVLFRHSRYTAYRGWKLADLEAALEAVRGQPEPIPAAKRQQSPNAVATLLPVELPAAPQRTAPSLDINRALCSDCSKALPPGRRCGRCAVCGPRHERQQARDRKRRQRTRNRQVVVV